MTRDAFLDEPPAEAPAAHMRLDEKQAQLRRGRAFLHQEHRADRLARLLGDPAALALLVEVLQELGDDLGDQRFE